MARRSEDRLGVELHSFNGVVAVTQPHHQPVVGLSGNGQDIGHRRSLDNERVIAGGLKGVG